MPRTTDAVDVALDVADADELARVAALQGLGVHDPPAEALM
jgi:hypothetical protein